MNESKDVPANPEENETADSNKKQKKEKKKRWSFRSFSFSKKDKQKPAKKEETNGECEKVPEEVSSKSIFVFVFSCRQIFFGELRVTKSTVFYIQEDIKFLGRIFLHE